MTEKQLLTPAELIRLVEGQTKTIPLLSPSQLPVILRRAREESGLSRAEVAERAGISRPYFWQVENGNSSASLLTLTRVLPPLGLQLVIRRTTDGEELAATSPRLDLDQATMLRRKIASLRETIPDGINVVFERESD